MKLHEFKSLLEANREKQFRLQLPDSSAVPVSRASLNARETVASDSSCARWRGRRSESSTVLSRCGSTVRDISHSDRFIACVFGLPRPTKTRNSTRATLVSRIAARSRNAKDRIAPAVYSPMPLNESSVW